MRMRILTMAAAALLLGCAPVAETAEPAPAGDIAKETTTSVAVAESPVSTTVTVAPARALSELPDRVASLVVLEEEGGRVSWSPDGAWILFDQIGEDGYFDIWLMRPDGSDRSCLTCDKAGAPQRHNGTAEWDPTGQYIVFTTEKQNHRGSSHWSDPGVGVYNDLWLMTADGSQFWPLTDLPSDSDHGALHPHFSHDGTQLSWSELHHGAKLREATGAFGFWHLKTADFAMTAEGPGLSNVQEVEPGGDGFYENHGFSPDDSQLLFTSNYEATTFLDGVLPDDYLVDLATGETVRLTTKNYNEQAHFTPDGSKIVWMASTGLEGGSDYWMMNPDGTDHVRVSFLNHPDISDHLPKPKLYRCTDFSFRPDGNAIVAFIQTGEGPPAKGFIVIMELDLISE